MKLYYTDPTGEGGTLVGAAKWRGKKPELIPDAYVVSLSPQSDLVRTSQPDPDSRRISGTPANGVTALKAAFGTVKATFGTKKELYTWSLTKPMNVTLYTNVTDYSF